MSERLLTDTVGLFESAVKLAKREAGPNYDQPVIVAAIIQSAAMLTLADTVSRWKIDIDSTELANAILTAAKK